MDYQVIAAHKGRPEDTLQALENILGIDFDAARVTAEVRDADVSIYPVSESHMGEETRKSLESRGCAVHHMKIG